MAFAVAVADLSHDRQCHFGVANSLAGVPNLQVGGSQVAQDSAHAVTVTDLPVDRERMFGVVDRPAGISN